MFSIISPYSDINYLYYLKRRNNITQSQNIELNITVSDSEIVSCFSRYDLFIKYYFKMDTKQIYGEATLVISQGFC